MTTFVGILPPENGGYNSCLGLVRRLQQRGDRVIFIGSERFKDYPLSLGLEYVSLLEELGPQLQEIQQQTASLPLFRRLASGRRLLIERMERLHQRQEEWLREVGADAILMDPLSWNFAVAPLKLGLPIIGLIPTFVSYANLTEPPVFSPLIPEPTLRSRLRNLGAWASLYARRWLPAALPPFLAACAGYNLPGRIRKLGGTLRLSEYTYRLQVPEIVMLPRELRFSPAFEPTPRSYLGGFVDPARRDPGFDWGALEADKPIAYCAIGTAGSPYRHGKRVLRAAIDAFRGRPDWQLVVALGNSAQPQDFEPVPRNILLAKFVPQIEVLQRARLFITHGGGASLREAMSHGVPLLVFPQHGDQFGLSARVVHHKLGLRGDSHKVDSRTLNALVDELTSSQEIAQSVKRMQELACSERPLDECVAFIDRCVAQRVSPPMLTSP